MGRTKTVMRTIASGDVVAVGRAEARWPPRAVRPTAAIVPAPGPVISGPGTFAAHLRGRAKSPALAELSVWPRRFVAEPAMRTEAVVRPWPWPVAAVRDIAGVRAWPAGTRGTSRAARTDRTARAEPAAPAAGAGGLATHVWPPRGRVAAVRAVACIRTWAAAHAVGRPKAVLGGIALTRTVAASPTVTASLTVAADRAITLAIALASSRISLRKPAGSVVLPGRVAICLARCRIAVAPRLRVSRREGVGSCGPARAAGDIAGRRPVAGLVGGRVLLDRTSARRAVTGTEAVIGEAAVRRPVLRGRLPVAGGQVRLVTSGLIMRPTALRPRRPWLIWPGPVRRLVPVARGQPQHLRGRLDRQLPSLVGLGLVPDLAWRLGVVPDLARHLRLHRGDLGRLRIDRPALHGSIRSRARRQVRGWLRPRRRGKTRPESRRNMTSRNRIRMHGPAGPAGGRSVASRGPARRDNWRDGPANTERVQPLLSLDVPGLHRVVAQPCAIAFLRAVLIQLALPRPAPAPAPPGHD